MNLRQKLFLAAGLPAIAVIVAWFAAPAEHVPNAWLQALALLWVIVGSIWLLRHLMRRFLWRVSRRLTFSYFLIGVIPIPLVALLAGVVAYILSGFFLGHLYRSTTLSLQGDLSQMAQIRLHQLLAQQEDEPPSLAPASFAFYKNGRRFAGDPDAPRRWRELWPCIEDGNDSGGVSFFADPDGAPTLLGCAQSDSLGVLARFDGDLEAELSQRAGIWIELARADQDEGDSDLTILYGQRELTLEALRPRSATEEILRFFGHENPAEPPSWLERPFLVWLEPTRPFRDPVTGAAADEYVAATLVSNLPATMAHLVPESPEVGFFVYLILLTVFLITLNLYILALLMATMMIFGLSRAVNRLTEATRKIQTGDFSTRIKVYRKDQLGALQTSFNEMAANLEELVQEAAEKEIFERELQLANEMQRGLLPDTLRAPHPLNFATYFRPSRAIGGDYYDLLELPDGRLAVVIADVSGHGLPAGLRMAMVKSAIELLCQDGSDPVAIFRRLHDLLRNRLRQRGAPGETPDRAFVTATLTAIDPKTGHLEMVAAGHPPTYLLRRGIVSEIQLPSLPLGAALPPSFPTHRQELEEGDVMVWLSDGLIEATDRHNDSFGYDRMVACLQGLPPNVGEVKKAILEAVASHYGDGGQLDDDLTLVVMSCGAFSDGDSSAAAD